MGPLAGIKVLDLSRVLAGPWASQILADMGADVIKVERPGSGDDTRSWGPPWLLDADGAETSDAAYFMATNRGKRSLAIDITSKDGQQVIRDLASASDIVVENFKVGGLAKYSLDYDSLKMIKPDLIWCSVTGFGQDGPYANRAGYDFMIQAMGGLMSITGEPDGEPGGGPQKVGVAMSDVATGLYSAIGILGALHHRNATGEGQHIDMSLLDVTVGMLANQNMNWLVGGKQPVRHGNAHPNIVPYQAFGTKDGHMILAVGNDRQFKAFCDEAGQPALATDARFATNRARVENRDALVPLVTDIMTTRTTAEWLSSLEGCHVPCGPINTIAEAFEDPQVIARGMKMDLPHSAAGSVAQVATPIKYSATPLEYKAGPPVLGEHTDEILAELKEKKDV